MNIEHNVYKDGKDYCITMSFDDGRCFDRRLIHIFNKYGIKGTFHLNSERFVDEYDANSTGYITNGELSGLYANHEISMHGADHLFPTSVPIRAVIRDMEKDREKLERLSGRIMRGMSYPFGAYNEDTLYAMRVLGVEYSRTTKPTFMFNPPEDFLLWHPTCHFKEIFKDNSIIERFFNDYAWSHRIFYIWGHSFELGEYEKMWANMEALCERLSGRDDTWYATNIEIKDYVTAQRNLVFNYDCNKVYNPSAIDVWIRANGKKVKIESGKTVNLH